MTNKNIMIISIYNDKGMGVRYIENALSKNGYSVRMVFYKSIRGFENVNFQKTNDTELNLLKQNITEYKPLMIGVSVVSSMYLETVDTVIKMIKENFDIPVVIGGVAATMCPEYFLEHDNADFVIRSDGELTVVKLADALSNNTDYSQIPSLCYRRDNSNIINEIEVAENIDEYGIPTLPLKDSVYIHKGKIEYRDPIINASTYDLIASRGCPFCCTYCTVSKLVKHLPSSTSRVRMRSVKCVIDELKEAKRLLKNLVFVRFSDESFTTDEEWVDEFTREYKKHINLPFTMWTHPKMVRFDLMKKLVDAGLTEVIMGIQSGSERLRKETFHRYEKNDDIINATKAMSDAGVTWATYDFILRHPFETLDDIKESYKLVKNMHGRYILNLRYMYFFPGVDIIPMAIEAGFYSKEEMDKLMYAPMLIKPFLTNFTTEGEAFKNEEAIKHNKECDLWYKMVFSLQFKKLKNKVESFEDNPLKYEKEIEKVFKLAKKYERTRNIINKIKFIARKTFLLIKRRF